MSKSTFKRSKFKLQRALGLELPGLGKAGALERRPYGPGVHGNKRKKVSDYAVRLKEKQKLVYHYALREKQLVNYVKASKRVTTRAWMDTLIMTLESRLGNVIFRLGWATSVAAANQMVSHGQVRVNGKKIDKISYLVAKDDVLELSEKGYNNQSYKHAQETPRLPAIPACYKVEGSEKKKATKIDEPLPSDIPFEYEGQLVIEYYWKIRS